MKPPTARQRETLVFIARFVAARGYPPSIREIGQALGLYSTSTTAQHLTGLIRKGLLTRVPNTPRTLALTDEGRIAVAEAEAKFVSHLTREMG